MTKVFLFIYDWFSVRRGLLCMVIGLIVAACIVLALRLDYQEDISAFLPQNEESGKYLSVYNNMAGQNRIVVSFQGDNVGLEELEDAMEDFGENLLSKDTAHLVHDLQIQVDETRMFSMLENVWEDYPLLMTEDDYRRADSLLSDSSFVVSQMEQNYKMLMLPTSGVMSQSIPHDPLHFSQRITTSMRDLNVSDQYVISDGYLFSREGDVGLVFLSSPYSISESKGNAVLSDMLDEVMTITKASHDGVKISAVGAPLIAVTNARQIRMDSMLAVTIAVVLIFAVLIYSFRRWQDIAWIGISILFGWLFAIGSLALFKESISIIVIGIGSVIIGIAVNYPLHYLDHLKHENNKREALKQMVPPLLIGNITTVSAFLCLVFLDADAMKDLGLFGSLMLVGTILFVLIALPVLVPTRKDVGNTYSVVPHILNAPWSRYRKTLFGVVMVITCVLGYYSLGISFDSDMQHINYMTSEQRQNLRMLSTSLEANDSLQTLFAVSQGEDMETALQNNEHLLSQICSVSAIKKVSSISSLMPSAEARMERVKRWRELWARHPDALTQLQETAIRYGFSNEAFSPFFQKVEHFDEATSAIEGLLDVEKGFVVKDSLAGVTRVVNFVQVSKDEIEEVKQMLQPQLTEGSFVFDSAQVSSSLVSLLSDNFNYIGFVCGFVVFFFLWLSFRSIELSLLSFLPLAVSWIWILGLMSLFGIQFNIVNIILATFIFGQGDDYTIFITEGLMYEYGTGKKVLKSYKNSVALSGIIMFIGIGTLILAKHPALRSLALVAIVGMITVVVMAYFLPPVVFHWLTEKNGKRREVPLTLKRFAYSLFSILFFILGTMLLLVPFAWIYFHVGKVTEQKRTFYHKLIQRISNFTIRHVPGASFTLKGRDGEDFDKPAVIIANHQSHLDLMCMLMLSPKVVLLTNDWVWNNWFYRKFIKYAEYYPVSDGFDRNFKRIQKLVERGYSVVIFPEGTRSSDFEVHRFHQGAFKLAQCLEVDILPVYLHGVGHVLPKLDFMLREGSMYVEVGERIPYENFKHITPLVLTREQHVAFKQHYAEICQQRETEEYFAPMRRYQRMYKGV